MVKQSIANVPVYVAGIKFPFPPPPGLLPQPTIIKHHMPAWIAFFSQRIPLAPGIINVDDDGGGVDSDGDGGDQY